MKDNAKKIIGCILFGIALVAIVISSIWALVFAFANPDMTELRQFLENPAPSIIAIVSLIVMYIGRWLIGD